jgi:hypothetical protein
MVKKNSRQDKKAEYDGWLDLSEPNEIIIKQDMDIMIECKVNK